MSDDILIRSMQTEDQDWVKDVLSAYFSSSRVVSRGKIYETRTLPGLVAVKQGKRVGLLHYSIRRGECEVVTILSLSLKEGIGRKLLDEIKIIAARENCSRIWLITTNDNVSAQAFYRHLGWKQVAVHQNAVQESRKLKPEIPEFGENGIPINDEIEFEWQLGDKQ